MMVHTFRIYIHSRRKVFRSSNVRFDEDGTITTPEEELLEETQPELLGNKGKNGKYNDSKESSTEQNSDSALDSDEEQLSPFEDLDPVMTILTMQALIRINLIPDEPREYMNQFLESLGQETQSFPSTTPSNEAIAFASFWAASMSTSDQFSTSKVVLHREEGISPA